MTHVTIRNQGSETIWHPRRCDLPRGIVECQGSPCYLPCNEGRKCSKQQPVVTQDQRYKISAEEWGRQIVPASKLVPRCAAMVVVAFVVWLILIVGTVHVLGRLGVI